MKTTNSERNCYQNCVTQIFKVVEINFLSLMYVSKHLTSMHLVNRNTRGEIICLLWIRLFRRKFEGTTLPQNISDNKTLENCRAIFVWKDRVDKKIPWAGSDDIISNDHETVRGLNTFFSNMWQASKYKNILWPYF